MNKDNNDTPEIVNENKIEEKLDIKKEIINEPEIKHDFISPYSTYVNSSGSDSDVILPRNNVIKTKKNKTTTEKKQDEAKQEVTKPIQVKKEEKKNPINEGENKEKLPVKIVEKKKENEIEKKNIVNNNSTETHDQKEIKRKIVINEAVEKAKKKPSCSSIGKSILNHEKIKITPYVAKCHFCGKTEDLRKCVTCDTAYCSSCEYKSVLNIFL